MAFLAIPLLNLNTSTSIDRPDVLLRQKLIIHALNRSRPEFAARISDELRAGRPMMVSAIVRYELEYGFARRKRRAANRALLETLLARGFEQHAFDPDDATEAGDIRAALEAQGTPIGPYDILIAAQVRRGGAAMVRLDRREFERAPGLIVTDWANWTHTRFAPAVEAVVVGGFRVVAFRQIRPECA